MPDSSPTEPRPGEARRPPPRRNLVEGPIGRTLFLFALPVLGGNALQNLNGTVNAFWVSHSLGAAAVAAISNANIIMQLLMGAAFGVSMAANIMIGQAFGARDMRMVKRIVGTATSFFVLLPVALAVFGAVAAPHILEAMRTPPDARGEAAAYLRMIFAATPFIYFFAYMQMAQRGGGDSTTPFYFMILAVLVDSTLNPLLIRGIGPFPRLGIAGAGLSTLIGQGTSLLAMMVFLYRRNSHLLLRADELHLLAPDAEILKALLVKGLPMGVQMIVLSVAGMMMITLVNHYGSTTTAAYGAASQIWTYVQMPAFALSAAVSSMAAQNVGAKRWDRIGEIAIKGVLLGLAVTGLVVVAIYGAGDLVLGLFLPPHSLAIPIARHLDHVVLWAYVLFSVTFTLSGVVRSTGAVWAPLGVLAISMWVIRVPFAVLLIPHFGVEAIWWSFPLGTITSAVLAALYYRFGGWRQARLVAGSQADPDVTTRTAEA